MHSLEKPMTSLHCKFEMARSVLAVRTGALATIFHCTHLQPQFYVANDRIGSIAASGVNVADGNWHSISVEKSGPVIRLIVDSRASVEITDAPEDPINTNTPLYIGGLPGLVHVTKYSCHTVEPLLTLWGP